MNKEYIEKHEAYLLLKHKAETYMLPATKEAYEKAAILIDSIKAHDVEPVRHGRWIDTIVRGNSSICCSECGSENNTICLSNYCHNCGAIMDKEVEE